MARPFLLRTRWLVGHILIATLVVGMLWLSSWQFDRLHQRKERNRETRAAMSASPLSDVPGVETQNFRSVALTGHWDANGTQLLRYPLHEGQPGYELITPFITDTGDHILVDRGWILLEKGKLLTPGISAPTDTTTVQGWYRRAGVSGGGAKPGNNGAHPSIPTITVIAEPWIQVRPGGPSGDIILNGETITPVTLDTPDLSEGPHFSYALQWISFSLIGIFGWASVLWKSWRDERMGPAR